MEIKNSKRILFLGARDAGILDVVRDLTGTAPTPNAETGSIAGLTHEWEAKTAYYNATVPIWIDEVADVQTWKAEFLKPEAEEVVNVVGAWVHCFRRGNDGAPVVSEQVLEMLRGVKEVVEHHGDGYAAGTLMLAVAVPPGKTAVKAQQQDASTSLEAEEEKCMEEGFEYIDYTATGKNEYGEKVGKERVREALEAVEWGAGDDGDDDFDGEDLDFDADDGLDWFERDETEWTAEVFGMKAALHGHDEGDSEPEDFMPAARQAAQVDDLDKLMAKMLAVKEQSVDLPEDQRKKLAAKAVRELMQEGRGV